MPVGGSVDEGVAILRYGEALRPSARCLYEAVEHVGGRLPRALCFRSCLAACVVGHYLAYKTTRSNDRLGSSWRPQSKQSNRH